MGSVIPFIGCTFPPGKLARSMGSEGASPKSSPRLNWTCFCTWDKGGHPATGVCREGGHLLACHANAFLSMSNF